MAQNNDTPDRSACLDPEVGALLAAYAEDDLVPEERRWVKAHLVHCDRCREDLARRQRLAGLMRENWPEIISGTTDHRLEEFRKRPAWPFSLLRRQVPVLIPLALAAILVFVVLMPRQAKSPSGQDWLAFGETVNYYVPQLDRSEGEGSSPCRVRTGQILKITLPAVPEAGQPVMLLVEGAPGEAGTGGLLFKLEDGFAVLTTIVPTIEPGDYTAAVLAGPSRDKVHQFTLVVLPAPSTS